MIQMVHAILFKLTLRVGHIPVKTYTVDSLHLVRSYPLGQHEMPQAATDF